MNEDSNATYKILDDEESSYTNISRDDIEVYLRYQGHSSNVLESYWDNYFSLKHLHLEAGLDAIDHTENEMLQNNNKECERMAVWCSSLMGILERGTAEERNIQFNNADSVQVLLDTLYGTANSRPLLIPLVPSTNE